MEENQSPKGEDLNKLDAIKQIIFGENIREYESEFKELKDQLLKQRGDLEKSDSDTRNELIKKIDELKAHFDQTVDNLNKDLDKIRSQHDKLGESSVSRKELGKWFESIGKKLQS